MSSEKTCRACGTIMRRREDEASGNWATRRTCNRDCSADWQASEPLVDRVLRRSSETPEGCWEFAGAKKKGYGRIGSKRHGFLMAHRVTYEHFIADIPEGLVTDHLCRNRSCVNPWHLDPVTDAVNLHRGVGPTATNASKTHCKRGHEFTQANTYINNRDGARICRACQALHSRAHRLGERLITTDTNGRTQP